MADVDKGVMSAIQSLSQYFAGTGNSNTVISSDNIESLLGLPGNSASSNIESTEIRDCLIEVLDALMSNSKAGFFMRDLMKGRVKFSCMGGEEKVFDGHFF